MALTAAQTQAVYRRGARHYDAAARLFDLAGFAEARYRREAVEALRLRPGARVVDVGCGTGLNLPHLVRAVGPSGAVFGVDLSDAMLLQACTRVRRAGWSNVRLVQADAAAFTFPPALDGILSTFALTLVPEFDDVVRRGAAALAPGGRFVVLDLKRPGRAPKWLVRIVALLQRPFGASLDLAERRPWESLARHLSIVAMTERYHGCAYLCVGEARSAVPVGAVAGLAGAGLAWWVGRREGPFHHGDREACSAPPGCSTALHPPFTLA
jgi:ubiquinone/menaquinone biosynthesis C-methylase UbiE